MIEVRNLTKKYGDHFAVQDISFSLEKGKIYGLLGPNGAGKSTTMNIMTGYIAATSGEVIIEGHDIFKEAEEAYWISSGNSPVVYGHDSLGVSVHSGRSQRRAEIRTKVHDRRCHGKSDDHQYEGSADQKSFQRI